MNDAALFAVSSVIQKSLTSSADFNIQLSRPIAEGELIARGRLLGTADDHCLAEAVLTNEQGEELARGAGAFVKSEVPLSSEMGYA
jgi:acyl-coenzyme A thioesterase PaaI-like protein